MNDDNTRDAAEPSPASAGSQADAWEIRRSDGALEALTPCVRMAEQILRCIGVGTILPLYRQPQPTLTDEERTAIEIAIPFLPDGPYTEYDGTPRPDRRATLRALLERTK